MKKLVTLMLALAMVLALAATASAADLTLLIASNQTSPENPYHFGLAKFKEVAEELSGGKIEVICHDGTLGENENELVEKLDLGAVNMIVVSPGFMTAIGVPEVDMLSLLYLFDSFDHWEAAMDGEFGQTMKDLILDKTGNNFRIMGYWTSSVRDYYGKKKVTTAADMKGMSIRTQTSGVVADFWTKLGATPSNVAWGELYQALQQKTYDAQENPIPVIYNNNLYEVQEYLSVTNHIYSGMCFTIAESSWNKLSADQQAIVEAAAKASADYDRQLNKEQTESLVSSLEEKGMKINTPELAPFAEATASVLTDNASTYGDLLDQLNAWKAER